MTNEHVDKRSENQFAAVGTTVIAPVGPVGNWSTKAGSMRTYAGTPQDVIKNVASTGRLFEGHNKKPDHLKPEGVPNWGVLASASTRPGGPTQDVATKEGRSQISKDLGLPNKKEFRAKKAAKKGK